MPSGDNETPKVGGTPEAANNSFNSGSEPDSGIKTIVPFPKGANNSHNSNNGADKETGDSLSGGDSVLSTKPTVIGGTPMGK